MDEIICIVGSHVEIPSTIPAVVLRKIRVSLTYRNPSYEKLTSLGIRNKQKQNLCFLVEKRRKLIVPRGATKLLMKIFREHGLNVSFKSKVTYEKTILLNKDNKVYSKLRPYQKACVDKMINSIQGYVVLPCGGGKTFLGASAALIVKQSTIVFVHTTDLLEQWKNTFHALGVKHVRIVGGGNVNNFAPLKRGEICIATVQTIDRSFGSINVSMFLNSAGVVILDEAHHCPAEMFQKVLQGSNARYRWGLTATPDRPDGFGFLMPLVIGEKLFEMKTSELVSTGHLMLPRIIPVRIKTNLSIDSFTNKKTGRLNMAKFTSHLSVDPERDATIKFLCIQAIKAKRKVLLLVPRVKQAYDIGLFLTSRNIRNISVTSKMKKEEREKCLDMFRRGAYDIIVATQLADEGLDLPNLDTLIQTNGGRSEGRAIQRVGRIMRISKNKKTPIVIDIVDCGPFVSQWQSRAMAYISSIGVEPDKISSAIKASKLF